MDTDLKSVVDRIIADFEFRTGEKANANQVIEALLASYSGAAHAIYRYIDNRLLQMFPATADEQWLSLWAERTGIFRNENESLDSWRNRIELALQEKNRFGRVEDFIAWGLMSDDIKFVYVSANTPELGATTVILGSDDVLSKERKEEIYQDITARIHAGSRLFIKQSDSQLVNLTIETVQKFREKIKNILSEFIDSKRVNQNATITIAELHSKIDEVTNNYTLIQPVNKIIVKDDNHLKLGVISWQ